MTKNLRLLSAVIVVALAVALTSGGVFAARVVNGSFTDLLVGGTAKVKTLQIGGDPEANSGGVTMLAPSSSGNGALAGSGLSATEYNAGLLHRTVLTFTDRAVALTDQAGTVAYAGTKIYDLPEGAIMIVGATANLALTKSSAGVNADWDGDFSLGTVTASNNATLSSTEQNILPTTATPQAVSGATTATGLSSATENAVLDGHATAADVYLNLLVDDADQDVTGTACNLIVNGTITLTWISLGDF